MIFFLFFLENGLWHFKQFVFLGDNLHEMSKPVFIFFVCVCVCVSGEGGDKKKWIIEYFKLSFTETFIQHAQHAG